MRPRTWITAGLLGAVVLVLGGVLVGRLLPAEDAGGPVQPVILTPAGAVDTTAPPTATAKPSAPSRTAVPPTTAPPRTTPPRTQPPDRRPKPPEPTRITPKPKPVDDDDDDDDGDDDDD